MQNSIINDDDPVPQTIDAILCEMADLTDEMAEIDRQFSAYKSGAFRKDDFAWHSRALARKGHLSRRVKTLKIARQRLLDAPKGDATARWKDKYKLLRDWVLQEFPQDRAKIHQFIGKMNSND